ncbi:MAG: glycoside hydrolase family 25 protein [Lachnospiraceae bacterium]
MKRTHDSRTLRKLIRFVQRNQKALALRALFIVVPVMLILCLVHFLRPAKESSTTEISSEAATLPAWESITYVNPAASYDSSKFVRNGSLMSYSDENYVSVQGIDVSSYTGDIDWAKVKAAGIRFAFVRLGYRGYTEGGISLDSHFVQNMDACKEQGIPVGVYFYSQAVNEDEAREEAAFCIQNLSGYDLALPIIYDPEDAPDETARTADLTGEQITANALAFVQAIEDAGYTAGIYANREWQKNVLDMTQFQDTIVWFAGFTDTPQTAYHFEYWQYSHTGSVDGIASDVDVDMDIRMVPTGSQNG